MIEIEGAAVVKQHFDAAALGAQPIAGEQNDVLLRLFDTSVSLDRGGSVDDGDVRGSVVGVVGRLERHGRRLLRRRLWVLI